MAKARNVAGSRRPPSKNNREPLVPIVFATLRHGTEEVTVKALLDTGAGASLMTKNYCDLLRVTQEKTRWATVAGNFCTEGTVKARFSLTELNCNRH